MATATQRIEPRPVRRVLIERRRYRWTELRLLFLPAFFMLLGLLELQVVQSTESGATTTTLPPLDAYIPAFGLIAALALTHLALNIIAPDADQVLLPIAGTLATIGVLMSLRLGPAVDNTALGVKQLVWVVLGLGLCVATVRITRNLDWLRNYKYTWAIAGVALVAVTLVNGIVFKHSFTTTGPSRDVLYISFLGFSFQPSELLKILLVVFFAGYLSENRAVLALDGYRFGPLNLPPFKHLGPLLTVLGVALLVIVGVRELGLAILIFGLALSMLYAASDRPMYVVTSLILFAVGAVALYTLFPYARDRVLIVGNAFDAGVASDKGYQIVQGLIAFASGGVFGSGLGLGHPTFVPEVTTDYIASAFGEEFGFAGILALIGLFLLLIYRGMHIAANARDDFNKLMAIGLTAVFALQTLVILAGNLKIMPLTGVPLPFVAYGGSSVIANFIIIGLLLRVSQADG
jgi:cell division protein FtsW (lipid II flippase)